MKADSNDELKNAFMRNHSYATFAYLKDKDFLVFKLYEVLSPFFKSVYHL